jgi:quinone-modifying oxidoreductase subunit QmoC
MTVEAAAEVSSRDEGIAVPHRAPAALSIAENGKPLRIDPDLDFIISLNRQSRGTLKKCMQCGTCSATCALAPIFSPFPRKEMAWAVWGLKDRLLQDPDIWLCYQCNDCSARCPRNARPGDIMAILRGEAIRHHAFPRFLGRWAGQPQSIPLLLAIPAALLTVALFLKEPIQNALGIMPDTGDRIMYSYSHLFPRWLINGFFVMLTAVAGLLLLGGVARLWRAMRETCSHGGADGPVKRLFPSIVAALRGIVTHDRFAECTKARPRYWSHLCVFFGFLGLSCVTIWVITAPYNPLIREQFIYPFSFANPWKILANLAGLALIGGCLLMVRDRFREAGAATGFLDWALIAALVVVTATGFITEVLHYVRLEPHRHLAYFTHLIFAAALLLYLPYSKFAHAVYRTTALVAAEYYGRNHESGRLRPSHAEQFVTKE